MSEDLGSEDMSTHNIALTALNNIQFHMRECDKRQIQNEKKLDDLGNRLEDNRMEISRLTKIAFAGTTCLFVILKLTDWFAPMLFHVAKP